MRRRGAGPASCGQPGESVSWRHGPERAAQSAPERRAARMPRCGAARINLMRSGAFQKKNSTVEYGIACNRTAITDCSRAET